MRRYNPPFKEWISAFSETDTNLGDLASDIARDSSFPDSSDKVILTEYISRKTHDPVILKTLSAAIDLYHAPEEE